ncbi:MAG: family 20 glycosylhydrolase [Clostridia bacterium]|nr:family 20 glycosylhydrolase [Clostridia bacterium]
MKYQLLPKPKSIAEKTGVFNISDCSVQLRGDMDYRVVKAAAKLRNALAVLDGGVHKFCRVDDEMKNSIAISVDSGLNSEEYSLKISKENILICGGDAAGCFYGIMTLLKLIESEGKELPCLEIKDYPDMKYRGFYHDATRGRVPSLEGVKTMVDRLAALKVNSLQLYVEHPFDFVEFKNDGKGEDQYLTVEEILEIDQYCYDNFIDFIPSLSSFGHLYHLLMKEEYKGLCELPDFESKQHFWKDRMEHHTIDPTNPKSFELICSLIDQYLPLFRSKYFNICCDETFDLAKGRNAGKDRGTLYCDFVTKIIEHVTSMGKTVMMWGDIALEYPNALDRIPKDTILLNWWYDENPSEQKVIRIKEQGITQVICPGTTSWTRLMELPRVSIPNITKFSKYGKTHDVLGILNTNWGDYGHPSSPECALFGTTLGACVGWTVDTEVDEEFEKAVSYFVYGSETNIIPMLSRVADIHSKSATWYSFFCWTSWKSKEYFEKFNEAAAYSAECSDIADKLRAIPDKKGVIAHIINAAEGVALLNEAVDVIRADKDREPWKVKSEEWLDSYEKMWLSGAKPSELYVIKEFIRKIMQVNI